MHLLSHICFLSNFLFAFMFSEHASVMLYEKRYKKTFVIVLIHIVG